MKLIDAHHHLWDLAAHRYTWAQGDHGAEAQGRGSYLIEDYLADAAHHELVASVHVEGNFDPSDPVAETAWLQSIAERTTYPQAIVAFAPLQDPDLARLLDAHARFANLRGVRHILNWDPDPLLRQCERPDYLTDRQWQAGLRLLARAGLSFDLQAAPWQMVDAARLAASLPDLQVVINHAGMPAQPSEAGRESWRRGMAGLARSDNVTVKLSGFGMFDPGWNAASIRPVVTELLELFGPSRCLFGSNFPVDRRWRSFDGVVSELDRALSDLSESEREAIFVKNAQRVYRLTASTLPPAPVSPAAEV